MAIYEMYIENKDPRITKPKPRFVPIILRDSPPLVDDKWWIKIDYNYNWIGTGYGDLKYEDGMLRFSAAKNKAKVRIVFFEINYPDDCAPKPGDEDFKSGVGRYLSPYLPGVWLKCEWSNRNIIPEEK